MTSRDGTEFYFGLNKLPGWSTGAEQTRSTWTMPVYGNNTGEPCHQTAFSESFCGQAWRWNLDYVVDRHNSTMSYFYTTETNNYAREMTAGKVSGYVRAGNLARIDYGQFDGQVYTTKPVGQVVLSTADRCSPGVAAADCVPAKPANWPDTPLNQACASTTSCPNKFSPTFWTQKRLSEIKTRIYTNGVPRDVTKWTLAQTYPATGDGTRNGMWLASVQQTGLANGTAALPPTTFDGAQMANRVDATNDTVPPMNWWRVTKVISDSGGQISVTYQPPECLPTGTRPAPDTNTMRCQPLKWTLRQFVADPVAVVKNVVKKIPGVKRVVHTVRKIVHNANKAAHKFYKKHIQPKIDSARKNWNAAKKAAGAGLKKAAKATWSGAKLVAKTNWEMTKAAGRVLRPGGVVWQSAKLGLGVAAAFGCVVCGAVSVGMSAVDLVIAAHERDYVGVATESADIATFGMGSKIAVGAKGGRAFAKWIWTGKKPPVGRLTSAAKDQLSKQKRLVESLDISLLTSDAAQLADEIHSKVRS